MTPVEYTISSHPLESKVRRHLIQLFYLLIFGALFINNIKTGLLMLHYITNISITFVFLFALFSYIPKTREFCLTYIALPAFGFA